MLNKNVVLSLGTLALLLYLAYALRQQPVYQFLRVTKQAYTGQELASLYTPPYIEQIREAFGLTNSETASMPDDSLFLLSLQKIIYYGIHKSNQYPTVRYLPSGEVQCRLHMKAYQNFDIIITMSKTKGRYVYHNIQNLPMFLKYFPEPYNPSNIKNLLKH